MKKKEVKNMDINDDKIRKEIENGAKHMDVSVEELTDKYVSICKENNLDANNPVALAMLRNYVRGNMRMKKNNNSGSNSLVKSAFGLFISLDAPRDMMAWNRNRAKEEYIRDNDKALEDGLVAVATENEDGTFTIARHYKGDYQEAVVKALNEGAEVLDNGTIIIPLDSLANYPSGAENRRYGKPLPVNEFRRSGIFFGSLGTGEMKPYYFSYKNQAGVDFAPNTFEWVHFLCIPSDDGSAIYGMTTTTLKSLMLNTEVDPEGDDYRDMSSFDFESCLATNFKSHLVPLSNVDRAHIERQTLPARERFIITDGSVDSITMTATANGNRIINISDLSAEFVEDGENYTTCWIPSHIDIDFGIASSVIVVGRTSQRIVDGVADAVTINVSGLMVTNRVGAPPETVEVVEDDLDWF
jgi:hypothetical protein